MKPYRKDTLRKDKGKAKENMLRGNPKKGNTKWKPKGQRKGNRQGTHTEREAQDSERERESY